MAIHKTYSGYNTQGKQVSSIQDAGHTGATCPAVLHSHPIPVGTKVRGNLQFNEISPLKTAPYKIVQKSSKSISQWRREV